MIYGCARVSTDGQSVAAQVAALTAAGARKVFREAASGAKTDHHQLRHVLDRLDAGDVLMVTRLDRLARSTRDLLNTLLIRACTGEGARGENGPPVQTHPAPAARGDRPPRQRRGDARRHRPQLQCQRQYDFTPSRITSGEGLG